MNVLVTGGAGYIGSHAVGALRRAGHRVAVLDNLFRGHRAAVPDDVPLATVDVLDTEAVTQTLQRHHIECVMHFAGLTYVHESVEQPQLYHQVNAQGTASLLEAMAQVGVQRMVFSSTCATYGEPDQMPITESTAQNPISPYGQSKLQAEQNIAEHATAHSEFAYAALRYFNVAGCADDGTLGEDHDPETHLIPLLLLTALGKRDGFTIFGDDYPTPDGTCIRDYIHVEDLVEAHIRVAEVLKPGDGRIYNLGVGHGQSVKQVLDAARRVTNAVIEAKVGPRREGDPPQLYACVDKIKSELDWSARYTDIDAIVQTAWRWFRTHPDGYPSNSDRA